MSSHHDATETYRLIITRRDATEILLLPNGTDWTLPRVEIRKQQRIAEELTAAAGKAWGLKTCCLFVPSPCISGRNGDAACVVMECVKHNEKAPAGSYWMPVNVAAEWGDAQEAAAIRDAFAELACYTSGEMPGPFAKPGWMRELFIWAHEQTAPMGLRLTGNFRQFNASPTFTLLRIETDGAALWFKATGEPNSHELPISVLLARLFPGYVPRILGVHPSWNGWLSIEASGTALDEISDCSTWERVAGELAELQIASIGKSDELLEGRCKDLRLPGIMKLINPFLVRMAELMAAQEKRSPAPLGNSELATLGEGLKESCSLLQSFGLPDALGHIDFNPGNILVSPDRSVFLDWAEGCVSNPLITFEYLREHIQRSSIQEPSSVERLAGAYVRPWTSFYPPGELRRALAVSPLIAVFVYAIASDAWRSSESLRQPQLAGYLRSLARRMYREALHAAERKRAVPGLASAPPCSTIEPVTEVFHGVPITDPYRWLEDQDSPQTRQWIEEQTRYARKYLDHIPGRERIRERIREFLAVETYDSLQKVGNRYFFRKRLPDQEQPCIYMREGADGEDHLLIDPSERGTGIFTAVKPLRISPDGRLLLYEVKEGGERTGTFELLEIEARKRLPDLLPRGYLRGFAFAPDGKSFYYVHEALGAKQPSYCAAYQHVLGTPSTEDQEIFFAGEDEKVRLALLSDKKRLFFFVYRFLDKTLTDVYLQPFERSVPPELIFSHIDYMLGLRLMDDKILAITDRHAPNRRIVEIRLRENGEHEWIDIVPENDTPIGNWLAVGDSLFVSYVKGLQHRVSIFDFSGKKTGEMLIRGDETLRIIGGSPDSDELLIETESFTEPIRVFRYSTSSNERTLWAKRSIPFDSADFSHSQIWFLSKDGTRVPMYLAGRRDVLKRSGNPTIMTSYGGYGVSMTPQFSIFVAFLMERGCLFALPNIRGGSEFGVEWHNAAKRRNRQTAYDDFLSAAEWLLKTGRTAPGRLAIFGGSNSGLLVGAALTQRPELFRAVVCMVPMLDMLRYHLFDNAHVWKEEFGTVEDPDDFAALVKYSPYHQVRDGVAYPATMIVSGDADRNCNPLHARKMTARLQAANASGHPIFLDYSKFRGHSPVLPLSERIEALTDRMAFLSDQFQLPR